MNNLQDILTTYKDKKKFYKDKKKYTKYIKNICMQKKSKKIFIFKK